MVDENGFDDFKKRFLSRKPLSERMQEETKGLRRSDGYYPLGYGPITNEVSNNLEYEKKQKGEFSPEKRKKIIEKAAHLIETRDKWILEDLADELDISLTTLRRQMNYFKILKPAIVGEAKKLVLNKKSGQK